MKYALAAGCLVMLTSASFPLAVSAEPQKTTTSARQLDTKAPEQPTAKEIEAEDRLGNFEIQQMMSTYGGGQVPAPAPKSKPKAPPPKPQ